MIKLYHWRSLWVDCLDIFMWIKNKLYYNFRKWGKKLKKLRGEMVMFVLKNAIIASRRIVVILQRRPDSLFSCCRAAGFVAIVLKFLSFRVRVRERLATLFFSMENSTARGEKDVELFFDDDSTDADIDEEVAEYKSDGENEEGNEEEGEERERSSSFYSQQWPQSFRFS